MLPQRRQNSSCDPCRRSKRRCFFSSPRIGDTDIACTHCERLGHDCTFEFVDSQAQKKRSKRARTRQSTSESAAEASPGLASGDFQADAVAGHDVLASWLDFDYLEGYSECLDLPNFLAPDAVTTIETSKNRLCVRPNLQYLIGSSLDSPIRLLNSKLDATILDVRLARIHDMIVTGCASRFADYDCNLYATACRYQLEDGNSTSQEQNLLSSSLSPQSQALASALTSQTDASPMGPGLPPRDPGCMMTVLGTVRFLDHFSYLYGNRLTKAARRQSDAVLKAVLRAFSLQWLSTTDTLFPDSFDENQTARDPLENAFHDAWFQAQTLLQNAQSACSFRVVYATLLFDGIAIPTKAHGAIESVVTHEFLDAGLQKLISLDTLVKKYCATLGSRSVYSALLEASLSVVRWGGYIRDIGAALTTDHHCKLPGILSHAKGMLYLSFDREILTEQSQGHTASPSCGPILVSFDDQDLHPDIDNSVPSICQKAVAEAFCVWRQIVEVKGSVSRHAQRESRVEAIASTVTAVGKFNQLFRPFMKTCIDNLERLSVRSRTSAGMLYSIRI